MSFRNLIEQAIKILDEGVLLGVASEIDFSGAGISSSLSGNRVTVTVSAGAGLNFAFNETPTGTINGSNTSFTLAHTPSPATSLILTINGQVMTPTEDYTISGNTITMIVAPETGDIFRAKEYQY